MTIRHTALTATQDVLLKFGLWIDRYDRQHMARRQRLIGTAAIDHLIDVGAHYGEYVAEVRRGGYQGLVTSFEANPAAYHHLARRTERDRHWVALPQALGAARGRTQFHVSENEVSSSLLRIGSRHLQAASDSAVVDTIEVEVRRLDEVWTHRSESLMLKLDVQGAEHLVLQGAGSVLPHVNLLEMELSVVELYEGQPTALEMLALIDGLGFRLAYPMPGFSDPSTGACLQINALFLR